MNNLSTQTNLKLPQSLLKSAKERAGQEGISLAKLIRQGIYLYLSTKPKPRLIHRESRSESGKRRLKELNEERRARRVKVKILELLKKGGE